MHQNNVNATTPFFEQFGEEKINILTEKNLSEFMLSKKQCLASQRSYNWFGFFFILFLKHIFWEEHWIANALDNQLIFLLKEHYGTLKSTWKSPGTSLNHLYIPHSSYLKFLLSSTFQKVSIFLKNPHHFLHVLPNTVLYYEHLYVRVCVYSWSCNKMAQSA